MPGAQPRQQAGARHARPDREERSGLRVAPLPPREQERGAVDPPCAPRRAGGVGARGGPAYRRALAARRRTRGMVTGSHSGWDDHRADRTICNEAVDCRARSIPRYGNTGARLPRGVTGRTIPSAAAEVSVGGNPPACPGRGAPRACSVWVVVEALALTGLAGWCYPASQRAMSSGFGRPPACTTVPSTTMPDVAAIPYPAMVA